MLILNGWSLLVMNWTSIKIKLPADINEWSALKQPLIDIAFTLRPNKCKSTVWHRLGGVHYADNIAKLGSRELYYEVIIPSIDQEKVEYLKDIGYDIYTLYNMPKHIRRSFFKRLTKPKKNES